MSSKYQAFEPGRYLDWEKSVVEERFAWVEKGPPKNQMPPAVISEYELLNFNRNWDPYNSLFNNKKYAQQAGYPDVPAWPCFKIPMGAIMLVSIPTEVGEDIADLWYFAHGPDDVELFAPIFPGDTLTAENESLMFVDITEPGSDLRHFKNGCVTRFYNQRGELVVRHTGWRREAYRKIIDGSTVASYGERLVAQEYPPAHYTTDEEWEYIKELWGKEYIRGKDTLYWEDVKIGDEPAWVCSGPITYYDMAKIRGGSDLPGIRGAIMNGDTKYMVRDQYGQYFIGLAVMYGGFNIPGKRAKLYNDTPAKYITRLVTNYIGDAGFVTRVGWMFEQMYDEMKYPREGGEYLDKVPYMAGKSCTAHAMEADTVIGKGYVTDKYVNDRGEHIIDLVCWGETLDKRIVEVVPVSAKLPSKG